MKRFIIYCISMLFALSSAQYAYAQQLVKGQIVEESNGIGIAGVSILDGRNMLGITDPQGNFSIRVAEGKTIKFRIQGFVERSVTIKANQPEIKLALAVKENTLDEAVVVGYARRTKETMTGSAVIITTKDIQDVPAANVMELLQGKVAGLNIQNNTGSPGMRGTVVLRGISNVNVTGQ